MTTFLPDDVWRHILGYMMPTYPRNTHPVARAFEKGESAQTMVYRCRCVVCRMTLGWYFRKTSRFLIVEGSFNNTICSNCRIANRRVWYSASFL